MLASAVDVLGDLKLIQAITIDDKSFCAKGPTLQTAPARASRRAGGDAPMVFVLQAPAMAS